MCVSLFTIYSFLDFFEFQQDFTPLREPTSFSENIEGFRRLFFGCTKVALSYSFVACHGNIQIAYFQISAPQDS